MINLLQPSSLLNSTSGSSHRVRVILPARHNAVTQRILTVRFHRLENPLAARRPGDVSRATA